MADLGGDPSTDLGYGVGIGIVFDCVFVEKNADEGGGGNGDERANNAGEGGSDEQGDEDGDAHEVDGRLHDARGKDGIFEVDVDGIEDKNAGHFGPGIEGGDAAGEDDGDDAAGDRDDVEQAHKNAEKDEVPDVQDAEHDRAADAEDEHEQTLAEEPLAHLDFGLLEGDVEPSAGFGVEEREEVLVDLAAFKHEVDAEEGGGEEIEDVGEPVGKRVEEIAGGRGESLLGALCGGVDAESIGEGKLFELGDEQRDAAGGIGDEGTEVAGDGRKGDPEEEEEGEAYGGDEKDDGNAAAWRPVLDVKRLKALDDGHENDGKERTDVEDLQLFHQVPAEGESENNANDEEDVAVDLLLLPGRFLGGDGGVGRCGWLVHFP